MSRPSPASLHERALDDIRYIRSAVENAGSFTAVSGLGGVWMGVVGLLAAAVAAGQTATPMRWLWTWLSAAVLASVVGVAFMLRKGRRAGTSLFSPLGRRFALALFPAIAAAGVLTPALVSRGEFDLLPPLWLLLYGVAVAAGGALSVRVVPFMGLVLFCTGLLSFFVPFQIANLLLGVGFGVVHVAGGVVIIRRYGG